MASTPSTPDTQPASPVDLQVPEERFWKRYSEHQELPLSSAGSFLAHALGIGLVVLLGFLASMFGFGPSQRSLPVQAVQVKQQLPGTDGQGGGGRGRSPGGPAAEGPAPRDNEVIEPAGSAQSTPEAADPARPALSPDQVAALPLEVRNDPAARRYIQQGNPNLSVFSRIHQDALSKLRKGLGQAPASSTSGNTGERTGPGGGSSGTGDGTGTGTGTGDGPGEGGGPSSGRLTQREKRMLRWTMRFDTQNGVDYLRQLQALGATLAIPLPNGRDYAVIRDLARRPARPVVEDLSKNELIWWTDANPRSVRDVAVALGLPGIPPHFVAFMPRSLEEKLRVLEKSYAGREEDEIFETVFRVRRAGVGYIPEVVSQRAK